MTEQKNANKAPNREQETLKTRILKHLKSFFTHNLAMKIVSVVFAVLLWGYVITDQKPLRSTVISNVPISFEGEAELLAQSLCVRGNRAEILQDVNVTVRTQITNSAYLKANSISATINLRNISEARTYSLPITASMSSALGVVQTVSPGNVEVEIDDLVTKTIPVTTSYIGEVPVGYWADMDNATTTARIDIQGPKTDVSRVVSAACVVPLEGQTSTIYRTFDVVLYDAQSEVVSADILIGTLPTSTVRVPIYPAKTVTVDVLGSLIGTDNLAANHVLYSAVATPPEVRIVGSQTAVAQVESLSLEPISVSGLDDPTTVTAELILPEGVNLTEEEAITVHIDVRESTISQTFEQVPIQIQGLGKGLTATLSLNTADLTIEGRYSLVSMVKRSDIDLIVDVTGLDVGTHTLPLSRLILDNEATIELSSKLSSESVVVIITK